MPRFSRRSSLVLAPWDTLGKTAGLTSMTARRTPARMAGFVKICWPIIAAAVCRDTLAKTAAWTVITVPQTPVLTEGLVGILWAISAAPAPQCTLGRIVV